MGKQAVSPRRALALVVSLLAASLVAAACVPPPPPPPPGPPPLRITTTTLGSAATGVVFDVRLAASSTSPDLQWYPTTALPPGLELGIDGALAGTPTEPGTYSIGVEASVGTQATTASFPLTVEDSAVTPVPLPFDQGDGSDAASRALSVSPGVTSVSSITLGAAAGLAVEVCGDPEAMPVVTVSDSSGQVLGSGTPLAVDGCVGVDPRWYDNSSWAASLPAGTYRVAVTGSAGAPAAMSAPGSELTDDAAGSHGLVATKLAPGAVASSMPPRPQTTTTRPLRDVRQVVVTPGGDSRCALINTGEARCWGANDVGQLGNGSTQHYSSVPVPVGGGTPLRGITKLYSGDRGFCALLLDGRASCWGGGVFIGDGVGIPPFGLRSPTPIGGTDSPLSEIVDLVVGSTMCAVLRSGQARCWGWGSEGTLGNGFGNGSDYTALRPVAVGDAGVPLSGITQIAGQGSTRCALLETGQVRCWGGTNRYGELGVVWDPNNYGYLNKPAPVVTGPAWPGPGTPLSGVTRLVAFASGGYCALLNSGQAACWGWTMQGDTFPRGGVWILSDQVLDDDGSVTGWEPLDGVVNVVAVAGTGIKCALLTSGQVRCGTFLQLSNAPRPTIPIPTGVTQIVGGSYSVCALLESRQARCWGWNIKGQLGNGLPNVPPTSSYSEDLAVVGGSGSPLEGITGFDEGPSTGMFPWPSRCALVGSEVACWGANLIDGGLFPLGGQLGDGTIRDSGFPTRVVEQVPWRVLLEDSYPNCSPDGNSGRPIDLLDHPQVNLANQVGNKSVQVATKLKLLVNAEVLKDVTRDVTGKSINPLSEAVATGVTETLVALAGLVPYVGPLLEGGASALEAHRAALEESARRDMTREYYRNATEAGSLFDYLLYMDDDPLLKNLYAGTLLAQFVASHGRCPTVQGGVVKAGDDELRWNALYYRLFFPGAVALVDPTGNRHDWVGPAKPGQAPAFVGKTLSEDVFGRYFKLLRAIRKNERRGIVMAEASVSVSGPDSCSERIVRQLDARPSSIWEPAESLCPWRSYPIPRGPESAVQYKVRDIISRQIPLDSMQTQTKFPKKDWSLGVTELGLRGAPLSAFPPREVPQENHPLSSTKSVRLVFDDSFKVDYRDSYSVCDLCAEYVEIEMSESPYYWVISSGTPLRQPDLNSQLNRPGYRYPFIRS
jgi:hypothetical protein